MCKIYIILYFQPELKQAMARRSRGGAETGSVRLTVFMQEVARLRGTGQLCSRPAICICYKARKQCMHAAVSSQAKGERQSTRSCAKMLVAVPDFIGQENLK